MAINIFEGARRVAKLVAGVVALGTAAVLFLDEPYMSVTYSIAHPAGQFTRMEEACPPQAGRTYFSAKTLDGKSISITLCELPMPFGENREC